MKSLVTGGAGFVGSHVAQHLLTMGHEVLVLDDLSGGSEANIPDDAAFYNCAICDHKQINEVFKEHQFDYVFHLAAYAAENLSHFIKRFNYTNNVLGSVNLINASVNHGVKCFVFTSSIAVYGFARTPLLEDGYPHPEDSYGIAKAAVEQELRISRSMFGLEYVIFRPHNVYGPGQNISDRYRNVVGIFMNQALKSEAFTIYGDGEQQRAFSYIDDVAPVIAKSIDLPQFRNETFNIGADLPFTINSLAAIIAKEMGVPFNVRYRPPRHEATLSFCVHRKLDSRLHRGPPVPLERGIAKMAAWVKKQGPRETIPFRAIEIAKNMPEGWP